VNSLEDAIDILDESTQNSEYFQLFESVSFELMYELRTRHSRRCMNLLQPKNCWQILTILVGFLPLSVELKFVLHQQLLY
jgi:hypothetical protein